MLILENGAEIPSNAADLHQQRPVTEVRRLVSVSNLTPVKGIINTVSALAILRDVHPGASWHYDVVGDGPERSEIEREIGRLGLGSYITMHGRVSYQKSMELVANGDIFVLPSWGEAFGIVYLEAMGRALPVIGCRDAGPSLFVADGSEGRLVEGRDIVGLSEAIASLLASPELSAEMGAAGRKVAEGYSWDSNVARIAHFLETSD